MVSCRNYLHLNKLHDVTKQKETAFTNRQEALSHDRMGCRHRPKHRSVQWDNLLLACIKTIIHLVGNNTEDFSHVNADMIGVHKAFDSNVKFCIVQIYSI